MAIRSIEEASAALLALEVNLRTETVPILEAYGRVLAADVTAQIPVPPFRRSAFDGYALISSDTADASKEHPVTLKVNEVIAAGDVGKIKVVSGTATRIMTGAMLPEGADTIIMHEMTEFTDEEVKIFDFVKIANVIPPGEDVEKGTLLVWKGKEISAADVAQMAGQGMTEVLVYQKPVIGIISTGSELVMPGEELPGGKIYNTNPFLLAGYIRSHGMTPKYLGIVEDKLDALTEAFQKGFEECDMIISTGGVSAGDYDYVSLAAKGTGADEMFHRIVMKPGGAMLAAVKDGKVLLGLSGNPGSAAVGMLRVGWSYMKKLCGKKDTEYVRSTAIMAEDFMKPSKGVRIIRGTSEVIDGKLYFHPIDNQQNGSVSSMSDCNIFAQIAPGTPNVPKGTVVDVYFI